MGKGDVKTKKGKISRGSYGVLRPKKKKKKGLVDKATAKPKKAKPKKEVKKEEEKVNKKKNETVNKKESKEAKKDS